jgi:protein gp37
MNKTAIEWTTFSANPLKYRRKSDGETVWACVKTSPGCKACYSEAIALRFDRGKLFNAHNMEELEPFLDEDELRKMRTAKTIGGVPVAGSRCFLADMTDLFGEWVSDDLLDRLFSGVLETRTDVTWQILTKRADRMRRYLSWRWGEGRIPARNIHVGVSVEDQKRADERIPLLLQTPAAVRFLSVEPLLGPIEFSDVTRRSDAVKQLGRQALDGIHWLIVGGESGPGARACRVEWVRSIVGQCRAAGLACFVKQLGGNPRQLGGVIGDTGFQAVPGLRLKDRKGGDMDEWSPDLRVREFPQTGQVRADGPHALPPAQHPVPEARRATDD